MDGEDGTGGAGGLLGGGLACVGGKERMTVDCKARERDALSSDNNCGLYLRRWRVRTLFCSEEVTKNFCQRNDIANLCFRWIILATIWTYRERQRENSQMALRPAANGLRHKPINTGSRSNNRRTNTAENWIGETGSRPRKHALSIRNEPRREGNVHRLPECCNSNCKLQESLKEKRE